MRLVVALAVAVTVWLFVALLAAGPRPAPGLHSVWCVWPGQPASRAVPFVVGPGTGLSGCPAGQQQVTEP